MVPDIVAPMEVWADGCSCALQASHGGGGMDPSRCGIFSRRRCTVRSLLDPDSIAPSWACVENLTGNGRQMRGPRLFCVFAHRASASGHPRPTAERRDPIKLPLRCCRVLLRPVEAWYHTEVPSTVTPQRAIRMPNASLVDICSGGTDTNGGKHPHQRYSP